MEYGQASIPFRVITEIGDMLCYIAIIDGPLEGSDKIKNAFDFLERPRGISFFKDLFKWHKTRKSIAIEP